MLAHVGDGRKYMLNMFHYANNLVSMIYARDDRNIAEEFAVLVRHEATSYGLPGLPQSYLDLFETSVTDQLVYVRIDQYLLVRGRQRRLRHLPCEIDLHRCRSI